MKSTPPTKPYLFWLVMVLLSIGACARPGAEPTDPAPINGEENESADTPDESEEDEEPAPRPTQPLLPARAAQLAGLMPLRSTGVEAFVAEDSTYDGRGVLIGILDSGLDLGLPGLATTTTGERKVLDVRDFSGEGHVELEEITVAGDTVSFGGTTLTGFGRVASYATPPFYAGLFRELPLGDVPAADVNGNGTNTDELPVFVVRTPTAWGVVTDTDGDGRLDDEVPTHDFAIAAETFTYGRKDGDHDGGPITIAVNLEERDGRPALTLFFDNSAHGSHVAGIAAGHNMFGVDGFNGVAPGAKLISLKIANNARGGLSVTGSMLRAMNYAADFAQQRGLPLILNMSFGVGNEVEGHAAIDSLVSEFALKHPDVLFVISAGNEGPGISTLGFPGSAEHILSVCALFPGAFSGRRPPGLAIDSDVIAEFSSRGGEVARPDLCAPGLAYSNVPKWNLGEEISGGTSMAAPQVAGAAALLQSAMLQNNRVARATDLRQALIASAQPARGGTFVDMGAGVPWVPRAYRWLMAGHQAGVYSIRAQPDGGNTSVSDGAYRRNGLQSPGDTIQRFVVRSVAGQPAARLWLKSDQRWLRTPESVEFAGGPATIELTYDARRLRTPGLYVGTVSATPASDTLAGPAFWLSNTIIVPQRLDQPFVEGRDLGPGRLQRYFFDVPEDAGGLTVEMELRYQMQRGSLFLFEPDGQPFRGGSKEDAGRGSSKVIMVVRGEDLVPGVYEAVVAAPSTSALTYDIRAGLPRFTIDPPNAEPRVTVRKREGAPELIQDAAVFQKEAKDSTRNDVDDVEVSASDIGAVRTVRVSGEASVPQHIAVPVPDWVGDMVVDVELPEGTWSQMTDFGVTLFDSAGAQVGLGPLTYGFGRHEFELRRRHRGQTLDIELFPAFAHLEAPPAWSAVVTIYLIARRATDLKSPAADSSGVVRTSQDITEVVFVLPEEEREMPDGFERLVEILASPAAGASSRRWARWGRGAAGARER